jgi:hypothetical protein
MLRERGRDDQSRSACRAAIVVPAILGLLGLITLVGRPQFQATRTVDALQLLAFAMLLGVAPAAILAKVRGGRG